MATARTLFALIVLMVIGACLPAHAKTLVFCSEGSPEGFDPALYTSGTTFDASSRTIYNRLVEFERGTTNILPGLAESWTISDDGLTYTFHLRRGVRFHASRFFTPSRDLNADDVIFSFERQLKSDHPWANYVEGAAWEYFNGMSMPDLIKSISKVDSHTVKLVLNRPEAPVIANLAMDFASILSREYADKLQKAGRKSELNSSPIGTGPFQFVAYDVDAVIRYKAFDQYWDGKQEIEDLIFAITPDAAVRAQKLKAGECHVTAFLAADEIDTLKTDPAFKVLEQPSLNIGYLAFNTQQAPFDNPKVRKALNMAIDRQAIVDAIFQGKGMVAKNPIPPTIWSYNDAIDADLYDPQAAKRALADAGVSGLKMKIWAMPVARPYNPDSKSMASLIQADLARIGVAAEIVTFEWGEYLSSSRDVDRDGAVLLGWTGDNGDPDNFLATLLGCDAVGGNNRAQWCNREFDELVLEAKTVHDPAERKRLYEAAQIVFEREAPWTTIAHSIVQIPVARQVTGYKIDPLGSHRFDGVGLGEGNDQAKGQEVALAPPPPPADVAKGEITTDRASLERELRAKIEAEIRSELQDKLALGNSKQVGVEQLSGRRLALVIGNNEYLHLEQLKKAVGDATAVSDNLRNLGFDVTSAVDLDIVETEKVIEKFATRISEGDVVFFHFSGHGIEINGENLLLATDVPLALEGESRVIRRFALSASRTIEDFQKAGAGTIVAVLDACRENPFGSQGVRSFGTRGGLGRMDTGAGTFIMFSAGIGQLALDRLNDAEPEPTSVFTRVLLRNLQDANLSLTDIAKKTQLEVRDLAREVGHSQTPAYYDQIVGEVSLH